MEFDVNTSDLREMEFVVMVIEGGPTLRVSKGIIAVFPLKAWITCFFSLLKTPEKVGEGLI